MTTRWGFLGASWVAKTALAPAVHGAFNATLQAVASRDPKRSRALEPIAVHNSYEELLADPMIDAVYISLANHQHCEWAVKALSAGKHVLCEKPLATNSAEARLMTESAVANDRLLVEAVWTRWHPRFIRMVNLVRDGAIGELRAIDSAFTFTGTLDGNYRLDPKMGGGSLLDVGPYQAHAWVALAGASAEFKITSLHRNLGPTGVDLTTQVSGVLTNDVEVKAITSFERAEVQRLLVTGTSGSIECVGNEAFASWKKVCSLRVGDIEEQFAPVDAFQVMVEAFGRQINGEQCFTITLSDTIRVAEILDQVRFAPARSI